MDPAKCRESDTSGNFFVQNLGRVRLLPDVTYRMPEMGYRAGKRRLTG
jgi:hypothetical protein